MPFNMFIPEANNGWQLLKKAKKLKGPGWILKLLENGKEWLIRLNCIENLVLWTETENLQYIQTQGVKPCDIVKSATSRYYTQSLLDLIKHCKNVKITAVTNQCLWIENSATFHGLWFTPCSNPGLSTSVAKDTWLENSWPGLLSPEKEKKPINIGAKSTNNRTKLKEYFWQNNPERISKNQELI